LNLGQMRSAVLTRLGEDTVAPIYWSDDDVNEAINDGYEELSDASEWYERSANIPFLSNLRYFDLRTALGDDTFLSPRRAFNPNTNWWLKPSDPRDLDFHTYRRWEINLGTPQRIIQRGLFYIGIFPLQNGDAGLMKFWYSAMPPALITDADEPPFPQEFHQGIIEYALFDLMGQESQTSKALVHWEQYQKIENDFIQYVNKRISTDRLDSLHEISVLGRQ